MELSSVVEVGPSSQVDVRRCLYIESGTLVSGVLLGECTSPRLNDIEFKGTTDSGADYSLRALLEVLKRII
jgi:hypothetical protein